VDRTGTTTSTWSCWEAAVQVLTAALTAATNGASVRVYREGGNCRWHDGGFSGGIVWIPAHRRAREGELPVDDAMDYLRRAVARVFMDDELMETFCPDRRGRCLGLRRGAQAKLPVRDRRGFPRLQSRSCPVGRPAGRANR